MLAFYMLFDDAELVERVGDVTLTLSAPEAVPGDIACDVTESRIRIAVRGVEREFASPVRLDVLRADAEFRNGVLDVRVAKAVSA